MSNLGLYKDMVVLAKKVGGPLVLGGLVAVGGWVVGRGGEAASEGVVKAVKKLKLRKSRAAESERIFVVSTAAEYDGLSLQPGDRFRVLEPVEDGVLIQRVGDDESPYVVTTQFLVSISDLKVEDVPE
jgi:hypothetical protein